MNDNEPQFDLSQNALISKSSQDVSSSFRREQWQSEVGSPSLSPTTESAVWENPVVDEPSGRAPVSSARRTAARTNPDTPARRGLHSGARGLIAIWAVTALLCGGCRQSSDPFLELAETKAKVLQVDDLKRAMELVYTEDEFAQKEFEEKVSTGLNRWAKKVLSDAQLAKVGGDINAWKLDPKASQLVADNAQLETVTQMESTEFLRSDAAYLRNCALENLLAKRICETTPSNALELYRLASGLSSDENARPRDANLKMVRGLHPELAEQEAGQLADALLLFDWVIRNVQLTDEITFTPEELEAAKLNDTASTDPAVNGVRMPGCQHYRWQLLHLGRGDYVERARLLIGLCRQRGLKAAMLEVRDRPWAVGVLIGGQLYLFDTRLGLPLPGATPGRIATLDLVRKQPELLAGLNLKPTESTRDDYQYWVQAGDLGSVRALIPVSPEALSRRMYMLQSRLVGDYQIPITEQPSIEIASFEGLEGVVPDIWGIEFRTHQFRQAIRNASARLSFDDQLMTKLQWYFENEAYVEGFSLYRRARDLFVLGRFESDLDSDYLNAIESFYNLNYSDKRIDNLSVDRFLLGRLGIYQERGQSVSEFQNRLRSVQVQMRLVRRDAGVFLALSHFDNGNAGAAANWLRRIRDREDSERWMPTVEYALGRSGEARREYDEAIKMYQSSSAAQFHGNLIRARLLGELTKTGQP